MQKTEISKQVTIYEYGKWLIRRLYENSVNSRVVNFKWSLGDQQPLIPAKDMVISITEINVLLSFF